MSTVVDSTTALDELQALRLEILTLRRENADARQEVERLRPFERKYHDLSQRFEQMVEEQDIAIRTRRNSNMSYADKFMYLSLIETYPELLNGTPMQISVCKVRENAGWVTETPAGNFFSALQEIGAGTYDAGSYDKKENERLATFTPEPDMFPFVETFNTRKTERHKKARDIEKKKRDERNAAWRLYQCEKCGSPDIKYGLHPKCGSCGHNHTPVEDIDANRITVTPIEDTDTDIDWTIADIPDESEPEPKPKSKPVHIPTPKQLIPTSKCPTCQETNWSDKGECITCWLNQEWSK